MAQSVKISNSFLLWQGKEPGMADLGTLLNMMPEAAVLLDRAKKTVLFPNSSLLTMTAFTRMDLIGSELDYLIPNFEIDTVIPGEDRLALLNRYNRDPLPIKVQANRLDVDAAWIVIIIEPAVKEKTSIFGEDVNYLKELSKLATLVDADCEEKLYPKLIASIQKVLKTDLVCIYQAESDYPELGKIACGAPEGFFPDVLPSTDLIRLNSTKIWEPGNRVTTELHRSGRMNNLAQIATTPLGRRGAVFGLLAVGYVEKQQQESLNLLVEFAGNFASSNLEHLILTSNLRMRETDNARLLAVRNSLLENVQEGVLVLSTDFRIVEINPAAELMLGYAEREVHGQNIENVLISTESYQQSLNEAKKGIIFHDIGSLSLIRRNGQLFAAKVKIIPVISNNELLAIQMIISDISEDEQIRVRTQQLEHRAVLGEFTAVFAHEVRNPINNISTGLQLLESRLKSDEKNLDLIRRMDSDCNRLNSLMDSVLSFSRPIDIQKLPVNLEFLLKRILDRWGPRMTRVKVIPYFQADENLPMVQGDERALEQVFTNLISNAIEIMHDQGGTLAVRLRLSAEITVPPQIEVTVTDNGPGIPDDIKDHIFEPFVSKNPRGTGLGLAITKQIVTTHRGTIKASTFPGGTVFHVFLPIIDGEKK